MISLNKRLAVVIPVSILVFILSLWFLSRSYGEIEQSARILISIGGMLVSGVITYFLFPEDEKVK
ncbi:histidine kinase [Bacillus salacetis]|uniref:Histidine kinase n=1 Tax=Bacillus salacetis TaxID=2315464 RepID=A0A3A1R0G6_9BACI|nr:histidine kinase [Bacillus salacetis]RIW35089.1 histidine kinase [Bacillus salacetis]